MCNDNSRCNCKPLFKTLNILTVPSLFILTCSLYVESNVSNFPTNSLVDTHDTSHCDQLRINQCNFYTTIDSPYTLGLRLYNMLVKSFKSLDRPFFK